MDCDSQGKIWSIRGENLEISPRAQAHSSKTWNQYILPQGMVLNGDRQHPVLCLSNLYVTSQCSSKPIARWLSLLCSKLLGIFVAVGDRVKLIQDKIALKGSLKEFTALFFDQQGQHLMTSNSELGDLGLGPTLPAATGKSWTMGFLLSMFWIIT